MMDIKNSMKTCSPRKKFKNFTDFHIFSIQEVGHNLWGLGVGSRTKNLPRLHIPATGLDY